MSAPSGLSRRLSRRLGAGALFLALAGCQTSDDPRQGGFISGVVNLATGGYDARVQREEDTLQTERTTRSSQQLEEEALRRERRQLTLDVAEAENRITTLERRVRQAKQRMAAAPPASDPDQAHLRHLEGQVKATRVRLQTVANPGRPTPEARGEVTEILSTIDDLTAATDRIAAQ
jgi:predicted  nucleic acid-binding Zn-ribbon protein